MTVRPNHTVRLALIVLEDALFACAAAPVARTPALRLALAYLYSCSGTGNRSMFDDFWLRATTPLDERGDNYIRSQGRNLSAAAALNLIYSAVDVERTPTMMAGSGPDTPPPASQQRRTP